MARRCSSTETNDLQLFSCVHILIFWLTSWKTKTEAHERVVICTLADPGSEQRPRPGFLQRQDRRLR